VSNWFSEYDATMKSMHPASTTMPAIAKPPVLSVGRLTSGLTSQVASLCSARALFADLRAGSTWNNVTGDISIA
jgi:hypothetical protein